MIDAFVDFLFRGGIGLLGIGLLAVLTAIDSWCNHVERKIEEQNKEKES